MTEPTPHRVPPSDLRAEESVLGAMLLSRDAVGNVLDATGLAADHFYKPAHSHIFDAIVGLFAAGDPADVVTVANWLAARNLMEECGGSQYLLHLQATTPAISAADKYAEVIVDLAAQRSVIAAGAEILELGYTPTSNPGGVVDAAEGIIFGLSDRKPGAEIVDPATMISGALNELEDRFENPGIPDHQRSGLSELDGILHGFKPGRLYVIGARPSMGKTMMALGVASTVAEHRASLFFTLEMSAEELMIRQIASEALVDSESLTTGAISVEEWTRISKATGRIGERQLHVVASPGVSVMDIRTKARRFKSRFGELGMIVVDYLQLMQGRRGAESRQLQVAEISRELKILAGELDVPVVALAQLNRQLEQRLDKRPNLGDLRETGAIENDADAVIFLFRDEVYDPQSPDRGVAEVIVGKNRHGKLGKARAAFRGQFYRFDDMAFSNPAGAPPPSPGWPGQDF